MNKSAIKTNWKAGKRGMNIGKESDLQYSSSVQIAFAVTRLLQ
jgi:hypothetical protein